jgi:hypothetical protein
MEKKKPVTAVGGGGCIIQEKELEGFLRVQCTWNTPLVRQLYNRLYASITGCS